MTSKDKKLAVVAILAGQKRALGLPEILTLLPPGYAERSVRRWLAELVDDGVVFKSGQKRGTRYAIASPQSGPPEFPLAAPGVFSQAALEAINHVRQPLFKRTPVSYNLGWFDSYRPNHSHYFQPTERAELARRGQRAADREPAGTYARRIYNRLLIDLSYNSSRLEGNTYSLIDTERLLVEGASAAGKLDGEKVMILNHKEAIRHLVDRGPRLAISYDEICTLHYLLSDGLVPAQYSGKLRDHGVRVGASTYIPLEDRARLEQQLQAIVTKAAAIRDPYEQSVFLLIHVAYLQAFTDVNKRTARLSANIPLLQHNLVPLSFNQIEKDDHASAMLAIYELNETRPLLELYTASYLRTCQEYNATAEALGFDELRVRYREQRRQSTRDIIAGQLIGEAMEQYIAVHAAEGIPDNHRADFLEDLREDLDEISSQRIAGLGISRQQLQNWLNARESTRGPDEQSGYPVPETHGAPRNKGGQPK
jgi:Fic family protein